MNRRDADSSIDHHTAATVWCYFCRLAGDWYPVSRRGECCVCRRRQPWL